MGLIVLLAAYTVWLLIGTFRLRFERDVARMVFNDNTESIEQAILQAGSGADSLRAELAEAPVPPAAANAPYIVVSIAERRVWYKQGDSVLFTAPVATGSGKQMVVKGSTKVMRFETPRGRLVVQRRDSAPAWIPPDWHFQEQANKRGMGLVQMVRGSPIKLKDGSSITVQGNDVVRVGSDGSVKPLSASDGREIVADGRIVIPPFGTNQRKYPDVLGTRRLYLGDGYALHGTNNPKSVGQAVSHGCVRLRNEDIEALYNQVSVGTLVYIY
ncbi:MAG TPA: L,D-transpeptidase [Gemmatimonas sp.]|uniref:L,D-transpeptidase n=1 Tax=Gemmatimonas sp. TaxID=1962908 RepID=UPI002EDA66EE